MRQLPTMVRDRLAKPWVITGIYLSAIYLTLPLMPYLVRGMFGIVGYDGFANIANSILLIIAVLLVRHIGKIGFRAGLLALPPLFVTVLVAFQMDKAVERLHFLEYGLLGILVCRASGYPKGLKLVAAFIGVVTAGAIDESIQYFLPNRYWDVRDIWFNAIGGGMGLWLGLLLGGGPKPKLQGDGA